MLWVMVAIAFIGFLDASYLAVEHFLGLVPPCTIVAGCDTVTTSGYAAILGIPVALLGSLYYLAIICCLVGYLQTSREELLKIFRYLTIGGLLASAYFVALQLFVIHAICLYCMVSATTSTLLFLGAWIMFRPAKSAIL